MLGKAFSKAKELTSKGLSKSKEYAKDKVHEQKRKIAVDVINSTDNKVKTKQEHLHLDRARQIVATKFNDGGWIGTKVYRKLDKKEFKVDDFKNYGSYQELFVKSNDGERIEITLGHPYKENDFLNNWSTNKMANGGGVEKMKKGARLDTNWVGNKTKENWGKNDLYEMYSNNLDLCADLHDYFKQLLEDSDENYTNEMKNNLIEVLKTGNLKGRNGKENLKFAQGGATKGFNYSIGGL